MLQYVVSQKHNQTYMQTKLDHPTLRKIGQHLGYPLDDQGVCYGFSCMLMQAILAQEESQFWQRLHLIATYQSNFFLLTTKIEAARRKVKEQSSSLTEQDNALLEILAFYEGIELYLNAHHHRDAFNKFISPGNVDEIYHLAKSTELKDSSLCILLNQISAHDNKESLMDYFNTLEKVIHQHASLPILIDSSNHSVLVTYNPEKPEKPWMYTDTNDFARYRSNPNYYRELNTKDLANALFDSLSKYPNPVVFKTKLVAKSGHPINTEQSLQQLQALYKIENKHTKMYDQFGAGLLYMACHHGHTQLVRQLVEHNGVKVNKTTLDGCTPFYIACQNGHTKSVQILLTCNEVEINKTNSNGYTPLYIACLMGHTEIFQMLLTCNRIEKNKTISDGNFLLCIACKRGYTKIVQILLPLNGVEINKITPDGYTPLYIACDNGYTNIVQMLLTRDGIKINGTMINGNTPLFIACDNGHTKTVELLLACEGIEINKLALSGCTPLFIACHNGHTKTVELLLACEEIKINKSKRNGNTPLYVACQMGHISCATLLLQTNKATIDSLGIQQHTPLLVACLSPYTQGKNELFRLLLRYRANPLHKNDEGQTAFDIAFAQTNHAAITELLVHAKNEPLSLDSETMNKARNWIDSLSKPDNHFFNPTLLLPHGLKRYIYDYTNPSDSNNLENKK